jgi:gluconokinase
MHAGHALDDADRAPWLALVRAWIDARLAAGEGGVIVCSALRRSYRDALVHDRPSVRIVYLEGAQALIAQRLSRRRGHFMPAGLLDSQFAALEPPGPDERPITVGIDDAPDAIAAAIATRLGFSQDS